MDLPIDGVQVFFLQLDLSIQQIQLTQCLFFLRFDLVEKLLDLIQFPLDLFAFLFQGRFIIGALRPGGEADQEEQQG